MNRPAYRSIARATGCAVVFIVALAGCEDEAKRPPIEGGREIFRLEHRIRSGLDQSVLPDKPLAVGQGDTPNPDKAEGRPK